MKGRTIWSYQVPILILFSIVFNLSCQKYAVTPNRSIASATVEINQEVKQGQNVNDLGIIGDGVTDNTDKIQAAVTAGANLFFPDGDYVIRKTILLNSFDTLSGGTNARFLESTSAPKGDFFFFTAENKSNIVITNLNFVGRETGGIDNDYIYAIYLLTTKNVVVSLLNCVLSGVVRTGVAGLSEFDYDDVNFATQSCDSLTINNCSGVGLKGAKKTDGILLRYINHWRVTNCKLRYYADGLTWWGGDSNPAISGALENERKCANGLVDHVHVEDVIASGIWGSMGKNITVTNSFVNNSDDLGINFEGCSQGMASSDTSRNSGNGALSAQYLCTDIAFIGNLVESNDIFRSILLKVSLQLSNDMRGAQNISFVDNIFNCYTGIGRLLENGSVNNLWFVNNLLNNSRIEFVAGTYAGNDLVSINNNFLFFDVQLPSDQYPIEAGRNTAGNQLFVQDNQINSSVLQGGTAIHIVQDQSAKSNIVNTISRNLAIGFSSYLLVTWDGLDGIVNSTNIVSTPVDLITSDRIQRSGEGNQTNSLITVDGSMI